MLKQNGYAQYQNAKIMTASPAELTLMLYEGAIKFGNIAIVALETFYRISGIRWIKNIRYGKNSKRFTYIFSADVMNVI